MNKTMISEDYLTNRFDFPLSAKLRYRQSASLSVRAILERIYWDMVELVCVLDDTVHTAGDVEARLRDDDRRELFRQAQAYQLIYQFENGKNTLILDETRDLTARGNDWCRDAVRILRKGLGFNSSGLFTQSPY